MWIPTLEPWILQAETVQSRTFFIHHVEHNDMHSRIVKLIQDSLDYMGLPSTVLESITTDAPIEFLLRHEIRIYLTLIDDNVWIASSLADYSAGLLERVGTQLIDDNLLSAHSFDLGKMFISMEGDKIVLQAVLYRSTIGDVIPFTSALAQFFEHLCQLQKIVHR